MEDKHHKEINDKLDLILKNQTESQWLPNKPYFDMLAPFRYLYEHPRAAFVAIVLFVDLIAELSSKGILTALLTFVFKMQ